MHEHLESFHKFKEPGNPITSPDRPNIEALIAKRNEYISRAIDVVIQKKDIGQNGMEFVFAVQRELKERSALKDQIPDQPKQENDFIEEFNDIDIMRVACDRYGITEFDYNLLYGTVSNQVDLKES